MCVFLFIHFSFVFFFWGVGRINKKLKTKLEIIMSQMGNERNDNLEKINAS